jgi:hypothetical protein
MPGAGRRAPAPPDARELLTQDTSVRRPGHPRSKPNSIRAGGGRHRGAVTAGGAGGAAGAGDAGGGCGTATAARRRAGRARGLPAARCDALRTRGRRPRSAERDGTVPRGRAALTRGRAVGAGVAVAAAPGAGARATPTGSSGGRAGGAGAILGQATTSAARHASAAARATLPHRIRVHHVGRMSSLGRGRGGFAPRC